ncbi:MAG: MliC family protein [Patescibacteria group bacterium]|nr:MliC family protein [Patescibacteria group bacterium]
MKKHVIVGLVAVGVLVAATFALRGGPIRISAVVPPLVAQPIASVSYSCEGGKHIDAAYYEGSSTPPASPDMPPTPGGSVKISLSDGRKMTLYQTISASGIRYANGDESFVFWSKGNSAFVMEGDNQTYGNCLDASATSSGGEQLPLSDGQED